MAPYREGKDGFESRKKKKRKKQVKTFTKDLFFREKEGILMGIRLTEEQEKPIILLLVQLSPIGGLINKEVHSWL